MNHALRKTILAGCFTALICAGAFIKVPLLLVPMTLQFFFVNFAALYQEKRGGALSVFSYLLLGLCGLPVFAGGGGIVYLLSPTFGYLAGFLLAALLTGFLKERFLPSFRAFLFLSVLNILVVHLCGLLYFYCLSNFYLGRGIPFSQILVAGSLIFLPNDLLSGVLSSYLSVRVRRLLALSPP